MLGYHYHLEKSFQCLLFCLVVRFLLVCFEHAVDVIGEQVVDHRGGATVAGRRPRR
jgi:hypothetical protein